MNWNELLLIVIVIIVFFYYRATCLRISNRYGERAVKVLERLYASEEAGDELKNCAHHQFHFFPGLLLPLLLPFGFAVRLIRRTVRKEKISNSSQINEFMKNTDYREFSRLVCQMTFSKRPLLWACSLMLSVCLVFVMSAFIGMFSSRTAAIIRDSIIESFNPNLMKAFFQNSAR